MLGFLKKALTAPIKATGQALRGNIGQSFKTASAPIGDLHRGAMAATKQSLRGNFGGATRNLMNPGFAGGGGGVSSNLVGALQQQMPQQPTAQPVGGVTPQLAGAMTDAFPQTGRSMIRGGGQWQANQPVAPTQPVAPAPVAPAAPSMTYDQAKAQYGVQRARQMQAAGQVSG